MEPKLETERGMADAKVTKLFDEREIAVRVEEIATKPVDRLPRDFLVVACWWAALSLSQTLSVRFIALAALRASSS